MARRYGTDHHEFIVQPSAAVIIPSLAWHYDEPYADESAVPSYYLSQLTRQHVTVALNGDGGDESFSGYARYATNSRLERFDHLPSAVRRAALGLIGHLPQGTRTDTLLARAHRWAARASVSRETRYARRMMHFTPELKLRLCIGELREAVVRGDSERILLDAFAASDTIDFGDAMLSVDVNNYLPDCLLTKVDIATMAHGLEGRSPLLDHELMEFAATLPFDLKRRGNQGKYILRRAAKDLLPPEILHRKKMGFGVPLEHWLRTDLREMTSDLLLTGPGATRGLFDLTLVRRMLDEHTAGKARGTTNCGTCSCSSSGFKPSSTIGREASLQLRITQE